jgi:hypothetical protein
MMKENGLPSANEMHQASIKEIREIINPDAILYLNLEDYGTKRVLLTSETRVTVSGKLVSVKTGHVLWEGRATGDNSSSSKSGGLAGMLINSVVNQAVNSSLYYAHDIASITKGLIFLISCGAAEPCRSVPKSGNTIANDLSIACLFCASHTR